jgi:hypothetical protein
MFKSKATEKDKDVAATVAEVVRSEVVRSTVQQQHSDFELRPPRAEPTTNAGHALASAPACRSWVTSNAMVQRMSSAESKANCAHLIS